MATEVMQSSISRPIVGRRTVLIGRVVSAIPVFMLVFSAFMKLAGGEQMHEDWASFGYPASVLAPIGVLELLVAALYAFPRTAALGAVLVTGYLGGAVATHLRLLQPVFPLPAVLGALAWLGLYLRDPRIRALLPLRRAAADH